LRPQARAGHIRRRHDSGTLIRCSSATAPAGGGAARSVVERGRYEDPPRWPPPRWVFLQHKLRRAVATAMPYLLATMIVCGVLYWWYAHPSLSGQSSTRAQPQHSPSHRTTDPVPVGASARCRDGTYSFSEHRASACTQSRRPSGLAESLGVQARKLRRAGELSNNAPAGSACEG
jgi:hypothetical protein